MFEVLKSKTALIIEDDEVHLKHVKGIFEMFFQVVRICNNVSSARNVLYSSCVDVIFSDICLGSENGLDFIEEIREANFDTLVVIISGHRYEDFLFRAIPLQLTAYLLKPIYFEMILEILAKCELKLLNKKCKTIYLKNNIYYDECKNILIANGKSFLLAKKERLFVELLCKNKNNVSIKEIIAQEVWRDEVMTDAALKNFVFRLRKRFGQDFIYTVNDIGYSLFKVD